MLLWSGIGDTIRCRCRPIGRGDQGRLRHAEVAGLRHRGVNLISCPSCARQQFQVIKTVELLEQRLAHITTPMSVSVIGCVVNGPGEAAETDIGFTGGGNGTHMVYLNGLPDHRLKDADIAIIWWRSSKEGGGDRGQPAGRAGDAGCRPIDHRRAAP